MTLKASPITDLVLTQKNSCLKNQAHITLRFISEWLIGGQCPNLQTSPTL